MRPKSGEGAPRHLSDDVSLRHLVFELGGEFYSCPLVKVREVIKVAALKPVPYTVPYFTGVLNLRGQMLGVVDLRRKFQLPIDPVRKGLILVVDLGSSLMGAHVDDVVSVEQLNEDEIRKDFAVESKLPVTFLKGIVEVKKRLVNVVDLAGVLSSQDLRILTEATKAESVKAA